MTTTPIVPGDLFARHQLINGLVDLAAFLEANPSVPIDEYGDIVTVFTRGDCDESGRAEVDRVAALLGVDVEDRTEQGGHYLAAKSFGRVRYRIVHIAARYTADHDARHSYTGNIRIDPTDQAA